MTRKRNKSWMLALILVNVLCLSLLAVLFVTYNREYSEQLQAQNLNDIAHLNESSTGIATSYLTDMEERLGSAADVIRHGDMNYEEACDFLYTFMLSSRYVCEIVATDGNGCQLTKGEDGEYIPVFYGSEFENLGRVLSAAASGAQTGITSEFTDAVSRSKSFAAYQYVTLPAGDGVAAYTLLLLTRVSDFAAVIQPEVGYKDIAVVIMNQSGDYIIGNGAFKSTNFYRYLKIFNELTLDEMNALRNKMAETGEGNLFYDNYAGAPCVFSCHKFPENDWYAVTALPLASFQTALPDYSFTLFAVGLLLFVLVFDVLYLMNLSRRLVKSAEKETVANNAKSDFLSRMSHDIRTPLNGIIGMTQLASDEPGDTDRVREYLNNIRVSGEFLMGLVNDILDVDRIEKGKIDLKPEPYSYDEFRNYVISMFAPLCNSGGLEFEVEENSEFPPLLLDKLRFNQICFNLLSNAIKYTPRGGHVRMSVKTLENNGEKTRFEMIIEDDGIGMSKEFQKHMFEAFSQENSNRYIMRKGGSGLGLAIVNGFVRLMGGTIGVESEEGKGTRFTVTLEADIYSDGERQKKLGFVLPEGALAGKKILLAEDNAINAVIARKLLEKQGMTVYTVVDGQQAIDVFAAAKTGGYDAILMDINMPVMDGYEATRQIRGMQRDDAKRIPIIAMTANAYDDDIRNALAAGMNAHVSKPVDPQKLYYELYQSLTGNEKEENQ